MPKSNAPKSGLTPDDETSAVAYVRMSTEHQRYSIDNQISHIQQYASARGFKIVRSYIDAGRSGLNASKRSSLLEMIGAVVSGNADFRTVLVYDISRWGRFQDIDESAHYEFLCVKNGVKVRYSAEKFENDGSSISYLLKTLKRIMAAEYSRELSEKVFQGHCRQVRLGFRQGARPGYGYRRLLVDEYGTEKCELKEGQRKNIQTDKVVLTSANLEESSIVARIFDAYVNEDCSEKAVAVLLNNDGLTDHFGRPWTRGSVRAILKNERYIGNYVYNQYSSKLFSKAIKNSPSKWIRKEGAHQPLISADLFRQAALTAASRSKVYTDEYLLECLENLLKKYGYLNTRLINSDKNTPSAANYRYHFGGLKKAYEKIGYEYAYNYRAPFSKLARDESAAAVTIMLHQELQRIGTLPILQGLHFIKFGPESAHIKVSVLNQVARKKGKPRWVVNFYRRNKVSHIFAKLIDESNPIEKFVFIENQVSKKRSIRIGECLNDADVVWFHDIESAANYILDCRMKELRTAVE